MPIRVQPADADIFDSHADVLVNPVNTVGVMGGGLAKQFKQQFPEMFVEYRRRCDRFEVRTGQIDLHLERDPVSLRPFAIANFPTKQHWRKPSRLEWIDEGLVSLAQIVEPLAESGGSVAIPPLGCGLGGLDWDVVRGRIVTAMRPLADAGVAVLLYPPASHN